MFIILQNNSNKYETRTHIISVFIAPCLLENLFNIGIKKRLIKNNGIQYSPGPPAGKKPIGKK